MTDTGSRQLADRWT